ncbi:MAG: hypothetical protein KGM98_15730, partial [Bacteroidota bacterium]|nr:hypothetical protein [Bacteroidota bacterium]
MKKFWTLAFACGAVLGANAQASTPVDSTRGWQLKDKGTGGYYGISLDKAYDFVKTHHHRKPRTVVVAVIDSGVDTTHEDLRPVLWHNPGEIPGNGIDDDHNGYIDDVYGWNFLGGKDGKNVTKDSYESQRAYYQYKDRFSGLRNADQLSAADKYLFATWQRAKKAVLNGVDTSSLHRLEQAYHMAAASDSIL